MPEILYLGNQLSKHGLNLTSVDTLGELLSEDYNLVRGSDKKNPLLRLLHMWFLVVWNRKAKCLLIDTYSSNAFWYAITTAWLARLISLPYISILRGGNLPKRKEQSPEILRRFLKHAAYVVCPSGFLKSEMEAFYSRDYKLIPNFIDLKNYPLCQKSLATDINILWVRSFHQIYNPSLAIDVLTLLSEKGLDARLAMVGPDKDGSLQKTKKYAADKGMIHRVRFTGGLSKSEWIEFSKDYNIFISTTDVDNTPVSVMEAMALGFPVISTDVGGVPFLIKSGLNGLLVPPRNALAFVNQIEKLIANPADFKRIRLNARKSAENWDWCKIRKKWSPLLNSISN